MNKKLLFVAMSLAAFTACTNDEDFESQKVAEEVSPVQLEVLNFNDEGTRASMDGNTITWSAKDGDLFSLYHGGAGDAVNGFQNATYRTSEKEGGAVLTTPSMILAGQAVMVWPVDTMFRIGSGDDLTIQIPEVQKNIENNIPYVSDRFTIGDFVEGGVNIPNTAGKDRKYAVYMRPMASQLNLTVDYDGTDDLIAELYEGGSAVPEDGAIDEIEVTGIDFLTATGTEFTTEIPVKWSAANAAWLPLITAGLVSWNKVTDLDVDHIVANTKKLSAKDDCILSNYKCKMLILPQPTIAGGVIDATVVVNTTYGKVVIAETGVNGSKYQAGEFEDAWYRYIKETTVAEGYETKATTAETKGENKGLYKTTADIEDGMMQTINTFGKGAAGKAVGPDGSLVEGEYMGIATNRYVKALLTYLDMSDLHITSDQQLRNAALVWEHLGLDAVTVYLDGSADNHIFTMSQSTVKTINDINDKAAAEGRYFHVKPCVVEGENCTKIWITGAGVIQDLAFIEKNPDGATPLKQKADVVLVQNKNDWKWDGTITVLPDGVTGIHEIINTGKMSNAEGKILNIADAGGNIANITFVNEVAATWNITAGRIRVQNNVRNNGTINIGDKDHKSAQLIADGNAVFTNNALALPKRFGGSDQVGTVNNYGVFATLSAGVINNYGLIEHADKDAKTYITSNETPGADFSLPFADDNMKGRINLPYSNKDEDNISISATGVAPFEGFISVTVDGDAPTSTLNAGTVGKFVNYMIVKGGIDDIAALPDQVEYLEVDTDHEVYWNSNATLTGGLIVLSDVNVKLGTTLTATIATYLGAEMYVGGTFATGNWSGYYGDTAGRVAEHYITY
jgi:hypothetical protein